MTTPREPQPDPEEVPRYDVAVVGLGYVGLPLCQAAVAAGLAVLGYDNARPVVESIRLGKSHIDDVGDTDVSNMLARGFTATANPEDLQQADAIIICVPTPLTVGRTPDTGAISSAIAAVAPHLRTGALVVLESTSYPGTTEEIIVPALTQTGRVIGNDVFVAYSPERVDPGNRTHGVANTPKVVGGVTQDCSKRAVALYERFIQHVVVARGPREAEMAKLLENTYRHVNIALVNEMAKLSYEMGIDFSDVIRCAETKPFGFQAFRPGAGVGGHCIPIDPLYLSFRIHSTLGSTFRFVELAQEINASMPQYVVQRVQNQLNRDGLPLMGARVLLVGVTYKKDVSDTRETPAREVAERLLNLGARVFYHDPLIDEWTVPQVQSCDDPAATGQDFDAVILLQDHACIDSQAITTASPRVFDVTGNVVGPNVETL